MQNLPIEKSVINPLWIITIFFIFSETTLGYVATKTTESTQIILTMFVVLFPTLVSIAFFLVLWFKHMHLYAPKDYQSDQSFLESARHSLNIGDLDNQIHRTVIQTLNAPDLIGKLENQNPQTVLNDAAENILKKIRENIFFTIDLNSYGIDETQILVITHENFPIVSDLILAIFFKLKGVKAFSYGYEWVLRNSVSHEIIKNSRMIANAPAGEPMIDIRKLEEVGIHPGTKLIVTKP